MGFNGSGVFQRVRNWVADATAGIKIRADYHDAEDDGFAAGLSNCITKDGQTLITQNIPFNSKRITGLADPVNDQDAATKASVTAVIAASDHLPATGGTISGNLAVTGTFSTAGAATFGSTLSVAGAVTMGSTLNVAGDITAGIAGRPANEGVYRFGNDPNHYLYYNGTNFTLSGGPLIASGMTIAGMACYGGIPISGNPGVTSAAQDQVCIILAGGCTINGPAHAVGTCITFYSNGGVFLIANNETMFWYSPAGATTGNRNLADRGIATALKIAGGHWVISGNGLT